jgi:hypothetical protein
MKVDTKGGTTVITDTKSNLTAFLMKLTHEYKSFEKKNVIVDISGHKVVTIKEINSFLPLSKIHNKAKKSFVLVADVDFNSASDKLVIVPTVQEAYDMIEMDEIQRDLGF